LRRMVPWTIFQRLSSEGRSMVGCVLIVRSLDFWTPGLPAGQ
jgi:hypothetical protein